MKRTKVVLDFVTYPVVEKVAFYRNIAIQLTDTSLFANLPTLSRLLKRSLMILKAPY